jgi:hypothetical protein
MKKEPVLGTRNITYNESNTSTVMVALIPFNCLFDYDVGLIKLIKQFYNDPSVFNQNTLDRLYSNKDIVEFVFNSDSQNIIMDIMNNPDEEIATEYYTQFMEREYSEILKNSVYTGLLNLVEKLDNESDATYSIVCLRKEEIRFMNTYLKEFRVETPEDIIPRISIFHQYFFKTTVNDPYFDIFKQYPEGETIYILDYRRNFKPNGEIMPNQDLLILEAKHNRFSLINSYNENITRKEFVDND